MNTVNLGDARSRSDVVPRRDRVRAATEAEILRTAHGLLVSGGLDALTLREVGRRMGMTASALYRYVEGHGDLVDRLVATFFADLAGAIRAAARSAAPVTGTDGADRSEDAGRPKGTGGPDDEEAAFEGGLKAAAREFRRWGLAHPAEFALMFGRDEAGAAGCPLAHAAGEQFGRVFLELFARGAGVQPDDSRDDVFRALPAPLDLVFARTWVRLLGSVMVEAAGQAEHLPFSADELFEVELADCWTLVRSAVRSARAGG